MSPAHELGDMFMRNGKRLTAAQASRRKFMQGLLASGAVATLAGAGFRAPMGALAQDDFTPYAGELAPDQVMRLSTQEPTTMDPGVSFGDYELDVLFNLFDGLVGVDERTGQIVPRVAETWDVSEDAATFTFHVRGVTWSDGTPLNAHDFEYSWKRVLDPDLASEYSQALFYIKNAEAFVNGTAKIEDVGVTATDDNTLTVTLEGPTAYFPLLAATWTYFPVPKHVIDEKGLDWTSGPMVSNGPFTMTSWDHNQKIEVARNEAYYGDKPTLTGAEYTLFADEAAQSYVAYENNELDYCAPEGPDLDRVLADPTLSAELLQFQRSNCYFIPCDTTNEPTSHVEFRQALAKAMDRNTLANTILTGQYEPAFTLLPTNIPGNNPDAAIVEDSAAAKQMLTDAGIDPSTVNLEFTYINQQFDSTVVQYLQNAWQEALGIKVTLSPIEETAYIDWRASRETEPFGVYLASWGSDFADATNWFNQNFTTGSDHYRNHWSDADFDALVGKAATNTNADERDQQYMQAEQMFIEQMPAIPVVHGKGFRAVKPYVKDLFLQPLLSSVHLRTINIATH